VVTPVEHKWSNMASISSRRTILHYFGAEDFAEKFLAESVAFNGRLRFLQGSRFR
jgi:hypothetical protein